MALFHFACCSWFPLWVLTLFKVRQSSPIVSHLGSILIKQTIINLFLLIRHNHTWVKHSDALSRRQLNPKGSYKPISHPQGFMQSSAGNCNEVCRDGTDIGMLTGAKQCEKYLMNTWGRLQFECETNDMSRATCRINYCINKWIKISPSQKKLLYMCQFIVWV